MTNAAVIAAHDARASASRGELDDGALLISMLPWAMSFADAPVSGFRVGAVALGASGAAYAGGNLEFAGAPLAASVHAEQAAVANAWLHGETAIAAIGASAEPCGHCRQFLMELGDGNVAIAVPGKPVATLGELLPRAFGPRDLDVRGGLLAASNRALSGTVDPTDELAVAALNAAEASYAPYTGAHCGVALRARDGTVVSGRYAECAAYNPSLPALQCGFVALGGRRIAASEIVSAVLVEAQGRTSQRASAEALLVLAAGIPLRYIGVQGNSTDSSALS